MTSSEDHPKQQKCYFFSATKLSTLFLLPPFTEWRWLVWVFLSQWLATPVLFFTTGTHGSSQQFVPKRHYQSSSGSMLILFKSHFKVHLVFQPNFFFPEVIEYLQLSVYILRHLSFLFLTYLLLCKTAYWRTAKSLDYSGEHLEQTK